MAVITVPDVTLVVERYLRKNTRKRGYRGENVNTVEEIILSSWRDFKDLR